LIGELKKNDEREMRKKGRAFLNKKKTTTNNIKIISFSFINNKNQLANEIEYSNKTQPNPNKTFDF
jgi:hypothetical protein